VTGGLRSAWIEAIRVASRHGFDVPVPTLNDLRRPPSSRTAVPERRRTVHSSRAAHRVRDRQRYQSCPTDLNESLQQAVNKPLNGSLSQSVENVADANDNDDDVVVVVVNPELRAAAPMMPLASNKASGLDAHQIRVPMLEPVETNVFRRESKGDTAVSVIQRPEISISHHTAEVARKTNTWSESDFISVQELAQDSDDSLSRSSVTRRHGKAVDLPESPRQHRSPSTKVRDRERKTRSRSPPPSDDVTHSVEDKAMPPSCRESNSSGSPRGAGGHQKDTDVAWTELLEIQVDCLRKKLEEKEAECARLLTAHNDLKTELLSHQQSPSDLDPGHLAAELEDLKLQHERDVVLVTSLQDELRQAKLAVSEQETKVHGLQGKLSASVDALGGAKQALQRSISELESERERSRSLAQDSSDTRARLLKAEQKPVDTSVELRSEISRLRQYSDRLEQDLQLHSDLLIRAKTDIRAKDERIDSLQRQNEELSSLVAEKDVVVAVDVVQQQAAAKTSNDTDAQLQTVDPALALLTDELQQSRDDIQRLQKLYSDALEDHKKQMQSLKDTHQTECDKKVKDIVQLTIQRDSRTQETVEAKLKMAEMERKVKRLELELASKEEQFDRKSREINDVVNTLNAEHAAKTSELAALQDKLAARESDAQLATKQLTELQKQLECSKSDCLELQQQLARVEKQAKRDRDASAREVAALQKVCSDLLSHGSSMEEAVQEMLDKEKAEWQARLEEVEQRLSAEREASTSELNTLRAQCLEMVHQATIADALAVSLTKAISERESLLDDHVKILLNKDIEIGKLKEMMDKMAEQVANGKLISDQLTARERDLKAAKDACEKLAEDKAAVDRKLEQAIDRLSACERQLKDVQEKTACEFSQLSDVKQTASKLNEDNVTLRIVLHQIATNVRETKQSVRLSSDTKFQTGAGASVKRSDSSGSSSSTNESGDLERDIEESMKVKQTMQELLSDLQHHRMLLSASESEKRSAVDKMEALERELADTMQANVDLLHNFEQLKQQANDSELEKSAILKRIHTLEQDLTDVKRLNEALQRDCEQSKQQATASDLETKAVASKMELLEHELADEKRSKQDLLEDLKQHHELLSESDLYRRTAIDKMKLLEQELAAVGVECQRQRDKAAASDKEVNTLKKELETALQQADTAGKAATEPRERDQSIASLKAELKLSNAKLATAQSSSDDLQQQLKLSADRHEAQIESERQQNKELTAKISALQRRLERYERQKKVDVGVDCNSNETCSNCKLLQARLDDAVKDANVINETGLSNDEELRSELALAEKRLVECEAYIGNLEDRLAVLGEPRDVALAARIVDLQSVIRHHQHTLVTCAAQCQRIVDTIERMSRAELKKALVNVAHLCEGFQGGDDVDASSDTVTLVARRLALESAVLMELVPLIERTRGGGRGCVGDVKQVLRMCAKAKQSLSAVTELGTDLQLNTSSKLVDLLEEHLALGYYVDDSALTSYRDVHPTPSSSLSSQALHGDDVLVEALATAVFSANVDTMDRRENIRPILNAVTRTSCIAELCASTGTGMLAFLGHQLHQLTAADDSENNSSSADSLIRRLAEEKDSLCRIIDDLVDDVIGRLARVCVRLNLTNGGQQLTNELRALTSACCMHLIEQEGIVGDVDEDTDDLSAFLARINGQVVEETAHQGEKLQQRMATVNREVSNTRTPRSGDNDGDPEGRREKRNCMLQLGFVLAQKIVIQQYSEMVDRAATSELLADDKQQRDEATVKQGFADPATNLQILAKAKRHLASIAEKRGREENNRYLASEKDLSVLSHNSALVTGDSRIMSYLFPELDNEGRLLLQVFLSASVCYVKELLRAKCAVEISEQMARLTEQHKRDISDLQKSLNKQPTVVVAADNVPASSTAAKVDLFSSSKLPLICIERQQYSYSIKMCVVECPQ
jgi:chromosome segregation ATPase